MAPCLLGGFTIAWTARRRRPGGAPGAVAPVSGPTVFVPRHAGLTAHARAALPAHVPHGDAAFNAGRAALLVHALTAEPELLFAATEDRLHQGYRAPGMPETAALVARCGRPGGGLVSGAGPTVLALTAVPEVCHPASRVVCQVTVVVEKPERVSSLP